jgi:hypothetical protein
MILEIDWFIFPWNPRDFDHYPITPTLPGFIRPKPSYCDLALTTMIFIFN